MASEIFNMHRLAASLVQAYYAEDEQQVLAIMGDLSAEEVLQVLSPLVDMVQHALSLPAQTPVERFIEVYRASIDQAEQVSGS